MKILNNKNNSLYVSSNFIEDKRCKHKIYYYDKKTIFIIILIIIILWSLPMII